MPLHRRIPKRGFENRFRREFTVVNLGDLSRRFPEGGEVTPEALRAAGLVRRRSTVPVKVLAGGDVQTVAPLVVRAHAFSKAAADKIQASGGRAEVLPA
jgi:large subunit ribosomal protein L15